MKKMSYVIAFILLFVTAGTMAQESYYGEPRVFEREGYAYKCELPYGDVNLYNADSRFVNVDWAFADGSPISEDIAYGYVATIEADDTYVSMRNKARAIVERCIPGDQRDIVKGETMTVALYIDPATGNIADVVFSFWKRSPLCRIPVETYRAMEVGIKEEVRFNIAPEGKKLNFCITSWNHTVSRYGLKPDLEPVEPLP